MPNHLKEIGIDLDVLHIIALNVTTQLIRRDCFNAFDALELAMLAALRERMYCDYPRELCSVRIILKIACMKNSQRNSFLRRIITIRR